MSELYDAYQKELAENGGRESQRRQLAAERDALRQQYERQEQIDRIARAVLAGRIAMPVDELGYERGDVARRISVLKWQEEQKTRARAEEQAKEQALRHALKDFAQALAAKAAPDLILYTEHTEPGRWRKPPRTVRTILAEGWDLGRVSTTRYVEESYPYEPYNFHTVPVTEISGTMLATDGEVWRYGDTPWRVGHNARSSRREYSMLRELYEVKGGSKINPSTDRGVIKNVAALAVRHGVPIPKPQPSDETSTGATWSGPALPREDLPYGYGPYDMPLGQDDRRERRERRQPEPYPTIPYDPSRLRRPRYDSRFGQPDAPGRHRAED